MAGFLLASCGASNEVPENAPELFAEAYGQNRQAMQKAFEEAFAKLEYYEKMTGTASLEGKIDIPAVTTGSFNLTMDSKVDYSNQDNPKTEINAKVTGEAALPDGTQFDGHASFDFIVDNGIFINLDEITLNTPDVPSSEFDALFAPFLGNWYGETYDSLAEITGQDINLSSIFMTPEKIKEELLATIDTKLFAYQEGLPAKDGFQMFKVKVDLDALEEAMINLMSMQSNPQQEMMISQFKELFYFKETFAETKKTFNNIEGELGFAENPKYFKFDGVASAEDGSVNISFAYLENESYLVLSPSEAQGSEAFVLNCKKDGDIITTEIYLDKEKSNKVFEAKKTDTSFVATAYFMGAEQGNINLAKEGETWKGTINAAGNTVNIDALSYGKNSFELAISMADVFSISMKSSGQEDKSVSITAPETYENIEAMMNTMEEVNAIMEETAMMEAEEELSGEEDYGLEDEDLKMLEGMMDSEYEIPAEMLE